MKTYSRWFTTKEKFFSTLWQKAGYKVIWTDENYDRTEDMNTHYKPNRKGGHTHNHKRNSQERYLNNSKESRRRTHNHLNKGYDYFFVLKGWKVYCLKIKPNVKERT